MTKFIWKGWNFNKAFEFLKQGNPYGYVYWLESNLVGPLDNWKTRSEMVVIARKDIGQLKFEIGETIILENGVFRKVGKGGGED